MQIHRAVENGFVCGVSGRMAKEDLKSPCHVARSGRGSELSSVVRLIGLNYRSAGLDVRSRASLSAERMESYLGDLLMAGAREAAVVSTCNRTEIYFVGDVQREAIGLLAEYSGMSESDLIAHLYLKSGVCAACHLFQVAAGLDSAVLGETEIVSQVKQGFNTAAAIKATGSTLDLVFKRALEASKRIRTETDLCRNSTSVGSLAVREAEALAGDLADRRIMVLGSGQIAERVAKELNAVGAKHVRFLNRSIDRAQSLASRFGFEHGPLDEIESTLLDTDVVFATTSAPHPIITQADVDGLMQIRNGRPLIAVDLGVPQNIESGLEAPGVQVVNMDTLVSQCVMNHQRRTSAIPAALHILYEELERVREKLTERQAATTIRRLTQHGEEVRERTLEWALGRLPELSDKERRVIEDMARRIVLGVITPALEELKSGSLSSSERQTVEKLFQRSQGEMRDVA